MNCPSCGCDLDNETGRYFLQVLLCIRCSKNAEQFLFLAQKELSKLLAGIEESIRLSITSHSSNYTCKFDCLSPEEVISHVITLDRYHKNGTKT